MLRKLVVLSVAIFFLNILIFKVDDAIAAEECFCHGENPGTAECYLFDDVKTATNLCPTAMGCRAAPMSQTNCTISKNDFNDGSAPPAAPVTPPVTTPVVPATPPVVAPVAPPAVADIVKPVIQSVASSAVSSAIIPECLLSGDISNDKNTECRSINIYVKLGLNVVNFLFGAIGAAALAVFIYGGVMLIISAGNQERIQAGTGAMLWAVVGLVIVFSAYLLVGFMSETLGLSANFKLL